MKRNNCAFLLDELVVRKWDKRLDLINQLRTSLCHGQVEKLEWFHNVVDDGDDEMVKFNRRITALCWHPKYVYTYAAGSKAGDVITGAMERKWTPEGYRWSNKRKGEIKGVFAGAAISGLKYHEHHANLLYKTCLDSTASRVDLEKGTTTQYHTFDDPYREWFTSLDVNFHRNILAAGSNRGEILLFGLNDQKLFGIHKLLKSKIHHIEFSKRDPYIFLTSGLDHLVKMWDLRKLNMKSSLLELPHECSVNVAKFNPLDETKILTSDQGDEIRVYELYGSTTAGEPVIIKHNHRQFQHLTPVVADWHPLANLIVIGKYPKRDTNERKTIQFYNADDGSLIREIYQPANIISTINCFNTTAELLASAVASELVIWTPPMCPFENDNLADNNDDDDQDDSQRDSKVLSQKVQALLRGRKKSSQPTKRKRGRKNQDPEYSPANSDDDSQKRKKKAPSKKKTRNA